MRAVGPDPRSGPGERGRRADCGGRRADIRATADDAAARHAWPGYRGLMTHELRVLLEIGKAGKRVVAGATDWPGLERWAKTDDAALERLAAYVPRYADVVERAGLAPDLAAQAQNLVVVERTPGNSSTDFWGIAHVPSELEHGGLSDAELERRLVLLQASWAYFDEAVARAPAELRHGPRGGGWTRDVIERHVHFSEADQMTAKVEVRTPRDMIFDPAGRAIHRARTLDAIRAYHAEGRPARRWPVAFLIRRMAQHLLDHAWELEDRTPVEDAG